MLRFFYSGTTPQGGQFRLPETRLAKPEAYQLVSRPQEWASLLQGRVQCLKTNIDLILALRKSDMASNQPESDDVDVLVYCLATTLPEVSENLQSWSVEYDDAEELRTKLKPFDALLRSFSNTALEKNPLYALLTVDSADPDVELNYMKFCMLAIMIKLADIVTLISESIYKLGLDDLFDVRNDYIYKFRELISLLSCASVKKAIIERSSIRVSESPMMCMATTSA